MAQGKGYQERTRAYMQQQWNAIEKEILSQVDVAIVDAMEARAVDILEDVRNRNSYERQTGNLDASIGIAMYANKGNVRKIKWMTDDEGDGARNVKRNISFTTRYGNDVNIGADSNVKGRESTIEVEKEYNDTRDKRIRSEMVLLGEMYYRYFLENINNGKTNVYVESFRYYEDGRQEEMDKWWKEIQLKMKIGKAMSKNVAQYK